MTAASRAAPSITTRAFGAVVRRCSDRTLERTLGSERGLGQLFSRTAERFDPERADGFTGDLRFDLRRSSGTISTWTITVAHDQATARAGGEEGAALTASLTVADALRILAGELDVGNAILEGRLDLAGDFGVAMGLGAMFGGRAPSR